MINFYISNFIALTVGMWFCANSGEGSHLSLLLLSLYLCHSIGLAACEWFYIRSSHIDFHNSTVFWLDRMWVCPSFWLSHFSWFFCWSCLVDLIEGEQLHGRPSYVYSQRLLLALILWAWYLTLVALTWQDVSDSLPGLAVFLLIILLPATLVVLTWQCVSDSLPGPAVFLLIILLPATLVVLN